MTDLYSVPKAVVLGDAMSIYTDGILGEGLVSHRMITVEQTGKESKFGHLIISQNYRVVKIVQRIMGT
jgi:hypothetical protein